MRIILLTNVRVNTTCCLYYFDLIFSYFHNSALPPIGGNLRSRLAKSFGIKIHDRGDAIRKLQYSLLSFDVHAPTSDWVSAKFRRVQTLEPLSALNSQCFRKWLDKQGAPLSERTSIGPFYDTFMPWFDQLLSNQRPAEGTSMPYFTMSERIEYCAHVDNQSTSDNLTIISGNESSGVTRWNDPK